MNDPITLTDASEQLGVHYMTVYKYVRTGKLAARKVAGQWWISPDDLASFESGAPTAPRTDVVPPQVVQRLAAGDENGAVTLLEAAMSAGADPEEVYLDLLGPAMVAIGARWQDGRLTIAQEHLATTTTLRVIARLGNRAMPRGQTKGTVVLAVIANDYHSIPTAVVRDLLRFRGFEVIDLGANTPAESILETALSVEHDLVGVGLTASTPGADESMKRTIKILSDGLSVPLIVGGGAFKDADHVSRLGNCIPTTSAREALERFDEIHDAALAR